ncbi:MAG: AI-2E family transporter [Candidatus Gastranaerophilaceae bacterium]|nr:AI-2E family transporter [Candidatus Gastranaerophilaceae bacterium]
MIESFFQKHLTGRNVIFCIIAVLFLAFMSQVPDVVIMFFASFVIACSLEPCVAKLSKKYKRNTASGIVLFGALILMLLFIVPLIIIAGHEIGNFADSFPQYMNTIKDIVDSSSIIKRPRLSNIDVGGMITSASGVTTTVIGETINFGKNIGSGFVYFIASLLIIYYFMADKDIVRNACIKMFPPQMRERTGEIYNTISQKIGGYIIAQIATLASVGVIMTIGLLILRVDYALLLGLMTCILDIIPIVGPTIALLICLVATYKAGIGVLIGVGIVFSVAQLVENQFVRPYVFGKFLDIHPLIIYLFLFITAKYLGIIGVVFAPAIAATVVVLIQEVYMKNIE